VYTSIADPAFQGEAVRSVCKTLASDLKHNDNISLPIKTKLSLDVAQPLENFLEAYKQINKYTRAGGITKIYICFFEIMSFTYSRNTVGSHEYSVKSALCI
jgi:hypothetical protein